MNFKIFSTHGGAVSRVALIHSKGFVSIGTLACGRQEIVMLSMRSIEACSFDKL